MVPETGLTINPIGEMYKSDEFAKSGINKKEMKKMSKDEKFRLVLNYELLRELMN